ncbi:MAG TPA: type I restriction-modification system subunit M [Candidatus Ligilactobacillus excrementigallinarum]|uniref:site-specific DNA-methyltransferase (adenine-specific) n=1 Tax=Candidatus Ligilactobacillus excrementigallinarum TaxID=2838641 RepID=A0A9D1UY17_9LACO|nr:type I restriction-modification system subunit M [Candidatus Ligilactobacillus excrementigallinarum]
MVTSREEQVRNVTNEIWAMANELRGNMDASEYRNYILGFMFYRYLSEHQEKYIADQELVEVEDDESINDAYRTIPGDEVNDYLEDISSTLGYAIAPEDTWATITQKVAESTIAPSDFQQMFDHFNENAKLNPNSERDFRGIFDDVNLGNSRLGNNTTSRAKSLTKIVELVDHFTYQDEEGHDILGDVYEYLIAEFAGNSGKKAGEFYTPHQVSKVLAKLVTIEMNNDKDFSVYDPAMGSGSLLLTVDGEVEKKNSNKTVNFYGQELNTTTYNLARMNLMMHDVEYQNMTLKNADSLEMDWPDGPDSQGIDHPRMFNAVVENPPYSAHWDNNENKLKDPRFKPYGALAPKTKADYSFLLHGLYHLKSDGTMAIILPHGVLFRGAKEGKIRQALIEKNQLDAVIGMPANLFYNTSIPTVILVLKKKRERKDILFIDASKNFEKGKNQNTLRDEDIDKIIKAYSERKDIDKFAHVATLDEIEENDFNLNIPRYVDTFEEEPPVDIKKVSQELQDINKKIKETESEFLSMVDELQVTDESKDIIEAIKEAFK